MNFQSREWQEVCSEIDKRIAALDKVNRARKSAEDTAHIRGAIEALLSFQKWPEATAVPDVDEIVFQ